MPIKFRAFPLTQIKGEVFEQAARAALREARSDMGDLFKGTTEGWDHKVKFRHRTEVSTREAYTAYGTDDDIYRFVSDGTKAHDIAPKNKPRLKFRRNYKAKTRPRSLRSGPGGSSGGWVSTKRKIRHPGTKARGFAEEVAKQYQPKFGRRVQQLFADAAQESQK